MPVKMPEQKLPSRAQRIIRILCKRYGAGHIVMLLVDLEKEKAAEARANKYNSSWLADGHESNAAMLEIAASKMVYSY